MPTNNTFIMLGLAVAGLWFMSRGGSEDDQVDQLAGAAMMASGEGTAPNAPFQAYSAPGNPSFFFNQGGQMTKVPGAEIPFAAASGEDIGQYPGGTNPPALEFEVDRSDPPIGTTDPSPTTPEFAGGGAATFITSTIWDNQAAIAAANAMPLLAVQTEGGQIAVLGSNVDISTLSSNEQFRAINVGTGDVFTSDRETVAEAIEQGYFTPPTTGDYVPKPWQQIEAEWRKNQGLKQSGADEDIGRYPGGGNPPALEFTVDQTNTATGTFDISLTTPQFAGTADVNITPATMWDEPSTEWWGAFGPPAVDTIKSTVPVLAETAPAWSGGDNWWDEG
jgi:hypothetical protein